MNTEGDVLLFHTDDNGDITVTEGITQLTGGFDTSFYLSVFGGNKEDDGSGDTTLQYWGNLLENDESFKYRSRTQNILEGLPASSANLKRLEEAVLRDLQWYVDAGIATSVEADVSIPEYNRVDIGGSITVQDQEIPFKFSENWKAAQSEG